MAASINAQDLKKRLTGVKPPSLIDVRRKTDYEADPNKIAGAIWRDPEKIEDWVKDLPSDAPAVVYCVRGGSVSQSVAHRLQQEGLNAVFLEGGLQAWTESGQAVEAISAPGKVYSLASSDIDLLRRAGLSEDDIAHSLKVAEKALEIARRTGTDLDLELVGRGATVSRSGQGPNPRHGTR